MEMMPLLRPHPFHECANTCGRREILKYNKVCGILILIRRGCGFPLEEKTLTALKLKIGMSILFPRASASAVRHDFLSRKKTVAVGYLCLLETTSAFRQNYRPTVNM